MLAEDVEDHRRAVDDLHLHDVFERAPLARGQLRVGDHRVGAHSGDEVAQLLGLASAQVGRGVGMRPPLKHAVENDRPGGLGEGRQLAQRVLGVFLLPLGVHPGEDDVLQAQLAVLDLGDVFEFGRQPRDASQRRAVFAIPLVAIVVAAAGGAHILQRLRPREHRDTRPPVRPRQHAFDGVERCVVGSVRRGGIGHPRLSSSWPAASQPRLVTPGARSLAPSGHR